MTGPSKTTQQFLDLPVVWTPDEIAEFNANCPVGAIPLNVHDLLTYLERGVQSRATPLGDRQPDILNTNKIMKKAAIMIRAIFDTENQPSQFGTVPLDDPNFVIFQMRPIAELDRSTDDTYLVRVENGEGRGWHDKGYYADDEDRWTDDAGKPIERGPWKITAFALWPDLKE